MTQTAAVFVLLEAKGVEHSATYMLAQLAGEVDQQILVVDPAIVVPPEMAAAATKIVPFPDDMTPSLFGGYKLGMAAVDGAGPVALTSDRVFGPIEARPGWLRDRMAAGDDVWAPYWHNVRADHRIAGRSGCDRAPHPDFLILGANLRADAEFQKMWTALVPAQDEWAELTRCVLPFGDWLARAGRAVAYPVAPEVLETANPGLFEAHKTVSFGLTLPRAALTLDPILHDLNATYLRAALESLRLRNADLADIVRQFCLAELPSRDFCTIADQYEVMPELAQSPGKTEWAFGTVAVFIHAFYAKMMPEFWTLIQRLPCPAHLYLTTATEEDAVQIRGFLDAKGWPADLRDVRVVAQNRGRDMSSLFITFRDVVMEGRHEVALRLHSKRTPQVSRQVGESFKDHLFENLAGSSGYVANLLDLLEANPDVGLMVPPVVHIGFGTLGHSWNNNRGPLQRVIADMGLDVPLDAFTPVTAYGTMYWFRTDALRRMFEWNWKWEDYNPEPNHVDGGLAHVQERLIGIVVQAAGYRTMSVMTPRQAARNYGKLEYKYQLVAGYLGSGNIFMQRTQLESMESNRKMRLYTALQGHYSRLIIRYPWAQTTLRPVTRTVQRLFFNQR